MATKSAFSATDTQMDYWAATDKAHNAELADFYRNQRRASAMSIMAIALSDVMVAGNLPPYLQNTVRAALKAYEANK